MGNSNIRLVRLTDTPLFTGPLKQPILHMPVFRISLVISCQAVYVLFSSKASLTLLTELQASVKHASWLNISENLSSSLVFRTGNS